MDGLSSDGSSEGGHTQACFHLRYLLMQVQRYALDEKWMPTKLDCRVLMPLVGHTVLLTA